MEKKKNQLGDELEGNISIISYLITVCGADAGSRRRRGWGRPRQVGLCRAQRRGRWEGGGGGGRVGRGGLTHSVQVTGHVGTAG